MKYRLSIVTWRDSTVVGSVWHTPRKVKSMAKQWENVEKDRMVTVGYLIRKTKHFLIFCSSIQFEKGKPTTVGEVFAIPKGCVIEGPAKLDLPKAWRKK